MQWSLIVFFGAPRKLAFGKDYHFPENIENIDIKFPPTRYEDFSQLIKTKKGNGNDALLYITSDNVFKGLIQVSPLGRFINLSNSPIILSGRQ